MKILMLGAFVITAYIFAILAMGVTEVKDKGTLYFFMYSALTIIVGLISIRILHLLICTVIA